MPLVDLAYLAENAKIRVSVRAFGVPIEFGDFEETPGESAFRCRAGSSATTLCLIAAARERVMREATRGERRLGRRCDWGNLARSCTSRRSYFAVEPLVDRLYSSANPQIREQAD